MTPSRPRSPSAELPDGSLPNGFIFATGIECSYPTVAGPNGRTLRVDELERTYHYRHWAEDLALVKDLGLKYLRYGPPYYRIHLGPDRYDWEFTDLVFAEMRRLGIIPITDLCHFGMPDWIGNFQNPDWPELFAEFAGAFARRFPWVQFYTPVNEIYVCAKLSTLAGMWNERRHRDDRAFVTAIKHLCRANLLAIREILQVRPDAIFIQSESAEYFHLGSTHPSLGGVAEWENERRFLSFDLLFSQAPSATMCLYLLDHGLTREEFEWFMSHGLDRRIVMGNDYYATNEQVVGPNGDFHAAGEVFGWQVITEQYFERYHRPVMHTETNTFDSADAVRWLWKEFFNVRYLRQRGFPVLGFTWYSLLDQVDWDSGLVLDRGVINACGLYDLQRRPRPVARAYRELLQEFEDEPLIPHTDVFAFYRGPAAPPPTARKPAKPLPQHAIAGHRPRPERAVVAIARSGAPDYQPHGIEALVREALEPLGGMRRFVQPGQTVLIKPNLTLWRLATEGVTTDPYVVTALIHLAREAGAGAVLVGECSSCGQVTREVMSVTGMEQAVRDAGAVPVYFDEEEAVEIDLPAGHLVRRIPVPRPLLEADVVIACPKLKTHFLDPITGAVKLWVGAVRQDVMHRLHRDRVQDTVADLLTGTRPDLCVMDAVIAGEGNGPIAVRPRYMGCVLASADPVALDVIAADLAGFGDRPLTFAQAAADRRIGISDRRRIDVAGVPLETARTPLAAAALDGWAEQYPVRVLIGDGVTLAGTLGHFKGFADFWQADHIWDLIVATHGKPTFMIGRTVDPQFEEHLKEGPYIVLDDVALDCYKDDPRVTFIPGSPIGNEMLPAIMHALGVQQPGQAVQAMLKSWERMRASRQRHAA